mgnify:CR=1 FL=1
MLEEQREKLGLPIIITSDARPNDENLKAGGVSDSLHLTGEAVDVKCLDIIPLDFFLFSCRFPWVEIGLYEVGIIHLGFSLNPERRIKRFFGFQCSNCIKFGPEKCPVCKGIGKIYKPISQEILTWYLKDKITKDQRRTFRNKLKEAL